ncbi:hypothetical protein [Streptantibioticus ferralitis]|uniref:Uncharacterized protein n=1 Tax=Streptantibioticus ferralitis TaxID=236510 RepID=A0ABT5Z182_9ACTN|nr:hypothetical protein [Streptantibioticus ferralitis]MDF2257599.1 hypothetical protein [Streptantibioticus ferralitis]
MSTPGTSARERAAGSQLAPGERLLSHALVVPVKNARGVSVNVGGMIGNAIMRNVGAQGGGHGSIAASCPDVSRGLVLRVTDQRVGLVNSLDGTPIWEVPRNWVARVERRPRLQLMARFRVHYADGSWLAFMTFRRRNIEAFRAVLGE